jgi:thiamine kinase-like enzyme
MIDTRIAEWKHLISFGELDNLLIMGNNIPPVGLISGLSSIAKKIFIACQKKHYIKDYYNDNEKLKHNVVLMPQEDDINNLPFAESSLQAITIINAPYKIESLLRFCHKTLSQNGYVIFILKHKNFMQKLLTRLTTTTTIKSISDLQKKAQSYNFSNFRTYGLVPSFDEVRWIIPLSSGRIIANSLSIYLPRLIGAKIKKRAARFLSKIGLKQLWTVHHIFIAKKTSGTMNKQHADLAYNLKKILKKDNIELCFFTGTPGYYQKTTVQIMDGKGSIIAYAKIAEQPQTKAVLENEILILNKLKALNLKTGSVPEAIYYGDMGRKTLLVQSAVEKPSLYSTHKLTQAHIDFLTEIFSKTAKKQLFKESRHLSEFKKQIMQFQGTIPDKWEHILGKSLEIISHNLSNEYIPLGLGHKDFTPWNTLNDKGSLFVIDWEMAQDNVIPFYDIFHFYVQQAIVSDYAHLEKLLKKLLLINTLSAEIYKSYNISAHINSALLYYFLLFYLWDSCAFYIFITKHYWDNIEEHKTIVKRIQMIDILLKLDKSELLNAI